MSNVKSQRDSVIYMVVSLQQKLGQLVHSLECARGMHVLLTRHAKSLPVLAHQH